MQPNDRHGSGSSFRAALRLASAAALLVVGAAQAAPVLRKQVDQHGDFVLFGNTVAQDCASGIPAPVVGTIGACGSNTSDTGADVFWRSDSPATGQAEANTGIAAANARSTALLSIPSGATITYARLYWGAMLSSNSPGTEVTLDRPGATPVIIYADASWSAQPDATYWWYQSSAEVTGLVQSMGTGAYRVGGIASIGLTDLTSEFPYVAWWVVVFYELPTDPLRNLALFDGFDLVTKTTSPISATISGFRVPNAGFQAHLGVVAYDGDLAANGDSLNFYRTGASPVPAVLSDAQNPANNFFNGTRSYLGSAVTVAGDLPQLTGTPGSMVGIDLDVVDVTSRVQAGDTSAQIVATTGGGSGSTDNYVIGAFITSISTLKPDFTNTTKSVGDVTRTGAVLAGDTLRYTITATNGGTDPSVNTLVVDALPGGVTFVPGSVTFSGPNGGYDYDAASRTLTARVGTGASSSQGGSIAVGGSFTVTFDVTVDAGASGSVANAAVVSAAGQNGNPQTSFPSHDPGGNASTAVVVDQCVSNSDCRGATPYCNTAPSPKVCVACLDDSGCGGSTPVCDLSAHRCIPRASLAPAAQSKTTVAGTGAPYALTLTNYLSTAETFDLAVATSSCGFQVELLADAAGSPGAVVATDLTGDGTWETIASGYDTNGNGKPDLGPTAGNSGTTALWLRLTPPGGATPGESCTAVVTATGAASGLAATASATATAGLAVTFTPDQTLANGKGRFVSPGHVVYFPGVVQNNGPTAQSFPLSAVANPAIANLAARVFYSDPNGDGDPSDGAIITATPAIAPFGGKAHVVLAVTASTNPGGGLPVGTQIGIDATAGSATQRDEAQVGLLTSYSDAAHALGTQRFAPCATAYLHADGLAAATPYRLYWFAKASPVLGTDTPARTTSLVIGSADDALAFSAAALGTWTVVLADVSGGTPGVERDRLVLTVERSGLFASLSAGPARQVLGASLSVSSTVRNDNGSAAFAGTSIRYLVEDQAQTGYLDATGVFQTAASGTTHLRPGLTVPAGATASDSFTLSPSWPGAGHYQVYAEWQLSCGSTPIVSSAVATFDVVPAAPVISAPAGGALLTTSRPVVAGTGLPGATVTLSGVACGPVAVAGDGSWTCTPLVDLSDGLYTAAATQTQNGLVSDASASVAFTLDSTLPGAPSVTVTPDPGGTSITVSGTAEPGSTVSVSVDGQTPVTVQAGSDGTFTVSIPTGDGTHTVTVTATDTAGNSSTPTTTTVTVQQPGGGSGSGGGTGGGGTGSGGSTSGGPATGGCGCNQGAGPAMPFALLGLLALRRRGRRTR